MKIFLSTHTLVKFFDLFKPKKNPIDELLEKDPLARKAFLWGEHEFIAKRATNLRAVGRSDDAEKIVAEFLKKVFQEFRNDPDNPEHLTFFTNIVLKLAALEPGKNVLEGLIKEREHLPIDLTLAYTNLGRIYHTIDRKRELWCYEMATEAKAPSNCKFPATRQQKAKAHQYAYFVAFNSLMDSKRAEFHRSRARELVPEVNWENFSEVQKFMLGS